ncbi:MAG: glycosyltransferase [Victivallales bacterium]|nr:glycosyltransferase [Victivallales bacterium]
MRILVFLEEAKVRGGIEVFAERHVAELREAGHQVLCLRKLSSDFDGIAAECAEIIVHKCSDVNVLERFPADRTTYYVHDHEPICPRGYAYTPWKCNCTRPSGLWPCLLCAPLRRNGWDALRRVFDQARRKRAMARFKRLVVLSEFMKSRLIANGMEAGRIEVRPPKINPAPSAHCALPVTPDLLYVGQLLRGKGVHLLLESLARMGGGRTLDIVGTGNMEGELKALADRLGVAGRVRFHGFQANPQDWMAAASCVVVPSFWQEPYGLVAAEAVALGKKVVAFAIGGLPEACQGRATLVPAGDVDGLARALNSPDPPDTPVKVFVFIDALGWKQAEKYGFARKTLPHRRGIEMQFGYSSTAIPTILSGKRPDEHGHLAFYDWSPKKSPFHAMGALAPFLKPRSFWRRGRVRNVLSRLIRRLYGFTGYFQLYAIPLERLPKLDYCEKRDVFLEHGLAPVRNLADAWTAQGMRWHISNWRLPETENFRMAAALLAQGTIDRAFVYSGAFDTMQHEYVGQDRVLAPKVAWYEEQVNALRSALDKAGRPYELTVISDHGMTPLKGTVDAPSALDGTGLAWGVDYASVIDSTMARLWWLKDGAKEKVQAAFERFPGHWLSKEEMAYHGIWREDGRFGDSIFLADTGVQFCPSDMGVKPLNGMHGFDPTDEDSLACWLSTAPVPPGVTRVCDYFAEMTAE